MNQPLCSASGSLLGKVQPLALRGLGRFAYLLIVLFMMMGVASNAFADFTYSHRETSVSSSFSPQGSTTTVAQGTDIYVILNVTHNSQDIWVDEYGTIDIREITSGPATNATVNFYLDSGNSSINMSSATVDSNGQAWTTLTMGTADTQLRAETTYNGYNTTANLNVTAPAAETFVLDRTETSLRVILGSPQGTTSVPAGEMRTVDLDVEATTWEVWIGSYGTIETRNLSTGTVSGGNYTLYLNGALAASGQYNPRATNYFTMPNAAAQIQADVTYNGYTASATLDFSVQYEEVFTHTHDESSVTVSLTSSAGDTLSNGAYTNLNVLVEYTSWEVWVNSTGDQHHRNTTSGAAGGAAVELTQTGDGSIGTGSFNTYGDGTGTSTFTMGAQSNTITANVSYGGTTGAATLVLNAAPPPEVFEMVGVGSEFVFTVSAPEGTAAYSNGTKAVQAFAGMKRFTVWTSNYGHTERRDEHIDPAANAMVTFYIDSGEGTLNVTGNTTDGNGLISGSITLGSSGARVHAYAYHSEYNVGTYSYDYYSGDASVDFTVGPPPPPLEEYFYTYTLSSEIAISLTNNDGGNPDPIVTPMAVSATVTSLEIWTNGYGNTETRTASYPATGSLSVHVDSGNGTITSSGGMSYEGTGAFTLNRGTQTTRVRVYVTHGADDGDLYVDFAPYPVFEYTRTETALTPALYSSGSTIGVATDETRDVYLQVGYSSYEVWTDQSGNVENRNYLSGAASGAEVSFSVSSGDGALTSSSGTVDWDGWLSTTYTMGSSTSSQVQAAVTFGSGSGTATLHFHQ